MSLMALQQDMTRWLTAEAPDAAARMGDRAGPGLAVYLNNYRGALMACLSESFPATKAWLGESAFETAAARYIDVCPPHSWTLDDYAEDFPASLETLFPEDLEVGELACLEHALAATFVVSDAPPLDLARLGSVDWDTAVLGLTPTLKRLQARSNAAAIWSAVNGGSTPPPASTLDDAAEILVWRHGFSPTFRTLSADERAALDMAAAGRPFGGLCSALAETLGAAEGVAAAGRFLATWIQEGLIQTIERLA